MAIDPSRVLARGTWLYDGTVPCQVFIQREEVWPALDAPEEYHFGLLRERRRWIYLCPCFVLSHG